MANDRSTDKVAVITGGSRGLGRNTAGNLAKRVADVLFTYHANQNESTREYHAQLSA